MPVLPSETAQIRQLDSGYSRETRSLLYLAYRQEPSFAYLFESGRSGYEHRVKATIRALVNQHYLQDLPALGLFVADRLVGVALIAPPQRRLGITESWAWRIRMLMSTGLRCTQRYLEYYHAVCWRACLRKRFMCCRCSASTLTFRGGTSASSCCWHCMTGARRT